MDDKIELVTISRQAHQGIQNNSNAHATFFIHSQAVSDWTYTDHKNIIVIMNKIHIIVAKKIIIQLCLSI